MNQNTFCKYCHRIPSQCSCTHPARESKAKDRFSNYESICLQCGTTIYNPAKTLTDEEIIETVKDNFIGAIKLGIVLTNDNVLGFARAILRKAQEK